MPGQRAYWTTVPTRTDENMKRALAWCEDRYNYYFRKKAINFSTALLRLGLGIRYAEAKYVLKKMARRKMVIHIGGAEWQYNPDGKVEDSL